MQRDEDIIAKLERKKKYYTPLFNISKTYFHLAVVIFALINHSEKSRAKPII